jgi:hypothetical protein
MVLRMIRFSEIDERVCARPGVYEIHTIGGLPLKVGIGSNLLCRLRSHRASRQSGLRTALADLRRASNPGQVVSKASILAKHLFFDAAIAPGYDLRSERGRREFLETQCRVSVEYCVSREEAAQIERERERTARFRYCRKVVVYPRAERGSVTIRSC